MFTYELEHPRTCRDRVEGEKHVRGKASGADAIQPQIMQYLRAGNWQLVSKLPVSVGQRTLDRIADNGWIEWRSGGARSEIKVTRQC